MVTQYTVEEDLQVLAVLKRYAPFVNHRDSKELDQAIELSVIDLNQSKPIAPWTSGSLLQWLDYINSPRGKDILDILSEHPVGVTRARVWTEIREESARQNVFCTKRENTVAASKTTPALVGAEKPKAESTPLCSFSDLQPLKMVVLKSHGFPLSQGVSPEAQAVPSSSLRLGKRNACQSEEPWHIIGCVDGITPQPLPTKRRKSVSRRLVSLEDDDSRVPQLEASPPKDLQSLSMPPPVPPLQPSNERRSSWPNPLPMQQVATSLEEATVKESIPHTISIGERKGTPNGNCLVPYDERVNLTGEAIGLVTNASGLAGTESDLIVSGPGPIEPYTVGEHHPQKEAVNQTDRESASTALLNQVMLMNQFQADQQAAMTNAFISQCHTLQELQVRTFEQLTHLMVSVTKGGNR